MIFPRAFSRCPRKSAHPAGPKTTRWTRRVPGAAEANQVFCAFRERHRVGIGSDRTRPYTEAWLCAEDGAELVRSGSVERLHIGPSVACDAQSYQQVPPRGAELLAFGYHEPGGGGGRVRTPEMPAAGVLFEAQREARRLCENAADQQRGRQREPAANVHIPPVRTSTESARALQGRPEFPVPDVRRGDGPLRQLEPAGPVQLDRRR